MKKLITLLRLRQEGFRTESYDDDFIIDIPENLVNKTTLCTDDILKYCEKQLRKAARATIIGPDCEKIITETCDDITGVILFCMPQKKSSQPSEYYA